MHRYSSEKRQKEIKRQKRKEQKKLRKEQKGTPEAERDEQALINKYLGIEEEESDESDSSEQDSK
ncbi:hypothetical protein [Spirochaeta cellobiosiphila]|uniref:hypothetical protein n=1 Tax=Spirochaeta cellobiosiphila TaxID=504483 RepID=UPI0004066E5C|nr:hypothetical protein [Spirochaeta cellobiosiphila]